MLITMLLALGIIWWAWVLVRRDRKDSAVTLVILEFPVTLVILEFPVTLVILEFPVTLVYLDIVG